ncbi:MAG: hypothetical protein GX750_10015 [Clostridia bacterium]|nr:hypothetical protein [Clostridia bacterium]
MKGNLSKIAVLLVVFLCLGTQPAGANAGPTYWQGYPAAEVVVVREDCPVEVAEERLLLDFNQAGKGHLTVEGRVTADYHMVNPTEEILSVEMAFPLVSSIMGFAPEDVSVTVDGKPVPFDALAHSGSSHRCGRCVNWKNNSKKGEKTIIGQKEDYLENNST